MARFEAVRMSNGYIICKQEDGKRMMYVHKVSRSGEYIWYSDYTYARRFGKLAAMKHVLNLCGHTL